MKEGSERRKPVKEGSEVKCGEVKEGNRRRR
jgi:hypothetical protein